MRIHNQVFVIVRTLHLPYMVFIHKPDDDSDWDQNLNYNVELCLD
jgi:hypothetical protein